MTIRSICQVVCDKCGATSRTDTRNVHMDAKTTWLAVQREGWHRSITGRHYCPDCGRKG